MLGVGMHSGLRDVSTLLAALAQGQTLTPDEYREKQQLVLELATHADQARAKVAALKARFAKGE